LGGFLNPKDGSGGVPVPKGDAHTAAREDFEVVRDGVVKDELGRSVDEDAGGERHGRRLNAERSTSNVEHQRF
jgi:hypothetical protein